jgi:hypothetical protein
MRGIYNELLCHWELTARYIHPRDEWILGWSLTNFGVKEAGGSSEAEWWKENTEAARKDIERIAELFHSFGRK